MLSGRQERNFSHVVLVGKEVPHTAAEALTQELHTHLMANGVKASLRHGRLRFSFHLYNNEDDVDRAVALLRSRAMGSGL